MEPTLRMLDTREIAPDTHVIRQLGEGGGPFALALNTMVITGAEPVVVDTGVALSRDAWLEKVFELVEPEDVRWIYLSHDDSDHTGNLVELLDRCANATLVTNWFSVERMAGEVLLPIDRMRWVNDGESFSAGDRELVAVTPPAFDSPTTRGLFDSTTGVYWGSDAFGVPLPHEVEDISELDPGFFREAFVDFHLMLSPWMQWVDPARYQVHLDRIQALGATAVANCHGVTLHGSQIDSAFELLREPPHRAPFAFPVQADLDAMLAEIVAAAPAAPEAAAA